MRYVAAYLLAKLAGNNEPDLKTVEKILSSVGVDCDKDKANKVLNELKGKKIEDLIKEGSTKLAAMPTAAPAAAGGAAPAAAKKDEPKKEEKKEEKKKEEKKKEESEDEDMGFGLFD